MELQLLSLSADRIFAIRGFIYIVPGILVTILLVKLYRNGEKYPDTLTMIQGNKKYLQILFVSLFCLSILALYFSSYRPWYYFLIITALFCVIFLQIFHDSLKPTIILFEISCVMGNLIFGLQLKYPLYFGLTDIIPHLNLSKITLLSGHIVPEDLIMVMPGSRCIISLLLQERVFWGLI